MIKKEILKNLINCYYMESVTERRMSYYTGIGMFKYGDGSKGEWGTYINGKREGEIVNWDRNVGVFRGIYKNDIAIGKMKAYYITGCIEESYYNNGIKEGKSIFIWKDGGYEERNYKDGRKYGEAIRYFNNGAKEKINYINNIIEGDSIYYYENGDYEERKYINNRIVGDGIFYHTNGYKIIKHDGKDELEKKLEILATSLIKRIEDLEKVILLTKKDERKIEEKINKKDILGLKQGKWEEEFKYTKEIGKYLNNKKEGKWKCYLLNSEECYKLENYENGKLLEEEYIIDITSNIKSSFLKWKKDKNGLKQGKWIEKIIEQKGYGYYIYKKVMNYEDNLLQGKYEIYDSDGNVIEIGKYKDDLKDGEMERYSFDQNIKKLIESGDYIEGKKEGQWFEENKIGCYLNNKRNGIWENIITGEKETYINGLLVGNYNKYYQDGSIEAEISYMNKGTIKKEKKYYKNGQIKEIVEYIYVEDKYVKTGKALESKGKSKYYVGEYDLNGEKIGEWREYISYEEILNKEEYFKKIQEVKNENFSS